MPEHDHEEEHEHGKLHFETSEVADAELATIRETNAPLADCLDLTRQWAALSEDERKPAADKQTAVEASEDWMPGYHADGDRCASCGKPTAALFTDRFQEGALVYSAFHRGLPVHPTRECLDGAVKARPDVSPRGLDKARRELMRDLERPTPRISQFFRHDVFAHPPFGLEDWGDSVAEAQKYGMEKSSMREIEKLLRYVHRRLFHG